MKKTIAAGPLLTAIAFNLCLGAEPNVEADQGSQARPGHR